MTRKFSTRILVVQCAIVLFLTIASVVLCNIFIHVYYNYLEEQKIMQAYGDIEELDLSALGEQDYAVLLNYEKDHLSIDIADEQMLPIYSTSKDDNSIEHNIAQKAEFFSRDPKIINRRGNYLDSLKLRAIITQGGTDYYVLIRNYTLGNDSISLVENFFTVVLLLMLIPSGILIYLLLKPLFAPINKLISATDQIAAGQFSEKISEIGKCDELNHLAKNINLISNQLNEQQKKIKEDRKQLVNRKLLQEKNEKKRKDLITRISHELKTPLAIISTQTEMLEHTTENQGEYIASIQEEIAKMSVMVSQILDSSVIEHQMENIVQKELDMKEVVKYISMKYEGLAKKKKINIETFLSEACYVYGDREYLEQAVNNYMMNAFEHTDIGGNIRVTLKRHKGFIHVSVYNEGKQIPKEELEHIWNSYYRNSCGASHVKAEFSNAGLGLYIVQNIITAHGGSYGVDNVSNGVEFWFTLPELKNSNEKSEIK